MKRKTSITLSDELFRELDRYAGSGESRSAYIERVLRFHFQRQTREAQQADDVERLNAGADRLNAEMAEVLEFQSSWTEAD